MIDASILMETNQNNNNNKNRTEHWYVRFAKNANASLPHYQLEINGIPIPNSKQNWSHLDQVILSHRVSCCSRFNGIFKYSCGCLQP